MAPASPSRLVIATRESALAMWQAEHVRARLQALYPACEVTLLGLTTQGDRVLDQALADIGGKGLFIKELEVAMAEGRADLAVHSLKDVPMEMPEGFTLAAITEREDARDALVSNLYRELAGLPGGARIGTSSLRREAQLRERDPLLDIRPLRGNVNTRLRKLDEGQYDAIILAAAGLKRLGFGDRIAYTLDPEESLPAVGQGALALECRADRADVIAALAPLAHEPTLLAVTAERAFSRELSGSCHTPLAAHAVDRHGELWLRGFLASRDGSEILRGQMAAVVRTSADARSARARARAGLHRPRRQASRRLIRRRARASDGGRIPRRFRSACAARAFSSRGPRGKPQGLRNSSPCSAANRSSFRRSRSSRPTIRRRSLPRTRVLPPTTTRCSCRPTRSSSACPIRARGPCR